MIRAQLDDTTRDRLHTLKRKSLPPKVRDRIEMVTLSDAGWSPPRIAAHIGYAAQTVRDRRRDFLARGTDPLRPPTHRPGPDPAHRDRAGRELCDMGVNPTPWGYCVYDDIAAKLIAGGIPREQVAAIGDADTDSKKQALFDRVRAGSVRVLIGSTAKMGTGTNVQKRLSALHHVDAPWKPAEVEQREGRILRQGNGNE